MVFLTAQHPNYSGACIVYELCFLTFVGKEMAHKSLQKNLGLAAHFKQHSIKSVCKRSGTLLAPPNRTLPISNIPATTCSSANEFGVA